MRETQDEKDLMQSEKGGFSKCSKLRREPELKTGRGDIRVE